MSSSEEVAINVSGVSKTFQTVGSPRKRLLQLLSGRNPHLADGTAGDFVALDQISFELKRGKCMGILGRNGSGKSTLLQIISGVMSPTEGQVKVNGRIAALLELGSGFNPDFSGIENVYLNASILGLSRHEIDTKMQTILDFAEIGDHVHLPVRTYSSGMMLRLAFAVQVAINPDILIIDEALAVGDARFQLKCFRRLDELKASGTTILFVSHATEVVKSFCDEALVLDNGKQVYVGDAKTGTVRYLETIFPEEHQTVDGHASNAIDAASAQVAEGELVVTEFTKHGVNTFGIGGASLTRFSVRGLKEGNCLPGGEPVTVTVDFRWDVEAVNETIRREGLEPNISVGVALADKKGVYVFGGNGFDSDLRIDPRMQDHATLQFEFRLPVLAEGDYFFTAAIPVGTEPKHVQLRWYDCFLPIRASSGTRSVYGMLAVDYTVERLERQP